MNFDDLLGADFKPLDDAVEDWRTLVDNLAKLKKQAEDGLHKAANKADWTGMNSQVTKEFIGKTAGEFSDAHTQSKTIHSILDDTRGELKGYQKQLTEAVGRGRKKNIKVIGYEGGFTVTTDIPPEARAHADKDNQDDINALRDDIQKILEKAAESDSSASKVLKALADQTEIGFSDASYKNRDDAAEAIKEAEALAKLAKKDPEDLTVKDFDRINAGLKKYKNDDLFSERFATTLGPKKTMEFWAGINNPGMNWDIGHDRRDQLDDLQRNLGMTLANASQSDSTAMDNWRRNVINLGDKPIYGDKGGPMGFQVMSNLMRTGDYEDQFMKDYGTKLMATERDLTGKGEHANMAWQHLGSDQILNRIGEDSGSDPLTGYLKGISNSPDAATSFFNQEFISKDESPFERDSDDENDYKGKVALTNFQYLFEEREWPEETNFHGDEDNTGRNNLALALEAATTGHPAGELPTLDTAPHTAAQAKLFSAIVSSVGDTPERLTDHGYMSDSIGQIASEYLPDINRAESGVNPELDPKSWKEIEKLYPANGSAADLDPRDTSKLLFAVGQNPEGYAAVEVAQKDYLSRLMDYHLNPDLPENLRYSDHYEMTVRQISQSSGEISGVLGIGRQEEVEGPAATKNSDYDKSIAQYKNFISGTAGTVTGVGTSFIATPWAGALVGGAVGTATGGVLESVFADAQGHVDKNDDAGNRWQTGMEENNARTSQAARLAAERYGKIDVEEAAKWASQSAKQGYVNARPILQGQDPGAVTNP
ncbi:hypothetical protein ACIREE_36300 [Streptomyces sp. NPDC102467]|uniref:hypothetical protein n=1 Tax=Streptomyces sp. NPDC102467 TaxID=3366179 RepID=UPI00382B95CB